MAWALGRFNFLLQGIGVVRFPIDGKALITSLE